MDSSDSSEEQLAGILKDAESPASPAGNTQTQSTSTPRIHHRSHHHMEHIALQKSQKILHQTTATCNLSSREKALFQRLIVRLAKALFQYGAPSYRVEQRITSIAKSKKIPIEIICQPTSILLSFVDYQNTTTMGFAMSFSGNLPGSVQQQTYFVHCLPGVDMGKLQDVDRLASRIAQYNGETNDELNSFALVGLDIESGGGDDGTPELMSNRPGFISRFSHRFRHYWQQLANYFSIYVNKIDSHPDYGDFENGGLEESLKALDTIHNTPREYSFAIRCLAHAAMSFTAAKIIFHGSWADSAVATVLGTLNQTLTALGQTYSISAIDLINPCIISILTQAIMQIFPGLCLGTVTLSSLLTLYPGVAITLSMLEMSADNINSGSSRLFFGFLRSLKIGFGLSLGSRLFKFLFGLSSELKCAKIVDTSWYLYLLVIPFTMGSVVTLRSYVRQFPMMLLVSYVGVLVSKLIIWKFNSFDLSNVVGAFAIGVVANSYGRYYNETPLPLVLSGIMFMVPGSVGVVGFYEMLRNEQSTGTNFALDIIIRAMSLALGLYLSNMVAYPMKKRRSKKNKNDLLTL